MLHAFIFSFHYFGVPKKINLCNRFHIKVNELENLVHLDAIQSHAYGEIEKL